MCCAFEICLLELCDLHNVLLEFFAVCCKGLVIERTEDVVSPERFIILIVDSYTHSHGLILAEISELEDRIVIADKELTGKIHRSLLLLIDLLVLHPDVAVSLIGRRQEHIKPAVGIHFNEIVNVGIGNCGIVYIVFHMSVYERFLE